MVKAFVLVRAEQGKLRICSTALRDLPEVVDVHEVLGVWDVVAVVEVSDFPSLRDFIQNKLQIVDGVSSSATLLCTDTVEFDG